MGPDGEAVGRWGGTGRVSADGGLLLRRWVNPHALSPLGSANSFRLRLRLTDLRTLRLAIASRDRIDKACDPSQVAASSTIHPFTYRRRGDRRSAPVASCGSSYLYSSISDLLRARLSRRGCRSVCISPRALFERAPGSLMRSCGCLPPFPAPRGCTPSRTLPAPP